MTTSNLSQNANGQGQDQYRTQPIFSNQRKRRQFKAIEVGSQEQNVGSHVARPMKTVDADYSSRFFNDGQNSGSVSPWDNIQQFTDQKKIPTGFIGVVSASKVQEDDSFKKDRVLRDLTGPYQEYTSFLTNQHPDKVFETLKNIVKKTEHCDYEFSENSYKARGRKFVNRICCEFQIHFFKKDTMIVVEFQKRSGDCWVFAEFFQNVLNQMNREGMVSSTKCFVEPLDTDMKDGEDAEIQEAGESGPQPMSIQEDGFLDMEPDEFLNLQPHQSCIDFDDEFAQDIWNMLVGKDTYHELRQHAAVTIATACCSESGRNAFKKIENRCVSRLLEEASKCFDAQIAASLLDAAYQFELSKEFEKETDGKFVRDIQRKWLTDSKMLCSNEIGKKASRIISAAA